MHSWSNNNLPGRCSPMMVWQHQQIRGDSKCIKFWMSSKNNRNQGSLFFLHLTLTIPSWLPLTCMTMCVMCVRGERGRPVVATGVQNGTGIPKSKTQLVHAITLYLIHSTINSSKYSMKLWSKWHFTYFKYKKLVAFHSVKKDGQQSCGAEPQHEL